MNRLKNFDTQRRRAIIASLLAVVAVGTAFFIGAALNDESSTVADLEDKLSRVESDLVNAEGEAVNLEAGREEAEEEVEAAEEELAVERDFKGNGTQQEAEGEYDTDYPMDAAGKVGPYIFKPTDITEEGEGKWVMTIEAKNDGSSPLEPFCGGGESILVDAEGNEYSGDSLLFKGGANCDDALQPGLTAKYLAEFHLPPNATPVAAYIYGEYELEEEGKTWELPR
jgi:hypothetical protein